MTVIYTVTPELRLKLKEPFGILITGTFSETMSKLADIIKNENPPKVVSVGDIVSKNLHSHKIIPQLAITDNKSMRRKVKEQIFQKKSVIKIRNPQGVITEEAIMAIQKALKGEKQVHILVEGEEDLLALIAILYVPENSIIIYGQPNKGIVVVKVTNDKRAETEKILKVMEINTRKKEVC